MKEQVRERERGSSKKCAFEIPNFWAKNLTGWNELYLLNESLM